MRPATFAILGIVAFVIAGAIRSDSGSQGMHLALTISWGLSAFGLFALVVAGVAIGMRLSRQ